MLERYEHSMPDIEMAHRDMTRREATRSHEALIAALPRKIAYLQSVLDEAGVHLSGVPDSELAAGVCRQRNSLSSTTSGEATLAARRRDCSNARGEMV
jgi:hypothetical protein